MLSIESSQFTNAREVLAKLGPVITVHPFTMVLDASITNHLTYTPQTSEYEVSRLGSQPAKFRGTLLLVSGKETDSAGKPVKYVMGLNSTGQLKPFGKLDKHLTPDATSNPVIRCYVDALTSANLPVPHDGTLWDMLKAGDLRRYEAHAAADQTENG